MAGRLMGYGAEHTEVAMSNVPTICQQKILCFPCQTKVNCSGLQSIYMFLEIPTGMENVLPGPP